MWKLSDLFEEAEYDLEASKSHAEVTYVLAAVGFCSVVGGRIDAFHISVTVISRWLADRSV